MRNRGARFFAKNNLSSGARREFAMAADEISVQVSFDDVLDFEVPRFGFGDVLIDVALRIDYGRFAI